MELTEKLGMILNDIEKIAKYCKRENIQISIKATFKDVDNQITLDLNTFDKIEDELIEDESEELSDEEFDAHPMM